MKRHLIVSFVLALFSTAALIGLNQFGLAQVATSTNYQIQTDSINFGGGLSTSTNYTQESTFGEIDSSIGTSTTYQLKAGYQQMTQIYLSITVPSEVTLSPTIAGVTGGTSNGSTTLTVRTDNPAGYTLSIEAGNNPAMQKGSDTIANYDQGADADYSFTVGTNDARFGFSPSSVDVVSAFKDNGSLCGVGSADAALACWAGITTTPTLISQGNDANHPNGATTSVFFRVGVGSGAGVVAGLYTATTTLTALPL